MSEKNSASPFRSFLEINNSLEIDIIGLPGSGKTRVLLALKNVFESEATRPGCFIERNLGAFFNKTGAQSNNQAWLVIDVRTRLIDGQDDWISVCLTRALHEVSGVIFSFSEQASLDEQTWWSQWVSERVADQAAGISIVRLLKGRFPAQWQGFQPRIRPYDSWSEQGECLEPLQTFQFELNRVSLNHLLMGLDNSKAALNMRIVRVKGVINTLEYDNLVAIEGTATRWDMFAADQGKSPTPLIIQGFGLEQDWLNDLVNASEI